MALASFQKRTGRRTTLVRTGPRVGLMRAYLESTNKHFLNEIQIRYPKRIVNFIPNRKDLPWRRCVLITITRHIFIDSLLQMGEK